MTHRHVGVLGLATALAACILTLAACGSGRPASPTGAWVAPPDPTSYVVVCDVTRSTLGSRDEYLAGLARVLEGVQPGDHVVVMSAEDSSVQNSELWIEEELPRFEFSLPPAPDTDNQLLLDAWQKEQEQRYRQGLEDFATTHDLVAWRDETLARVENAVKSRAASGTDLAGAVYLAGQLLGSSSGSGDRRLVLFTDGLIQTPSVDWRSGRVTAGDVKRLVKQERSDGALPDLKGVQVTLIGARAEDEQRLSALRGAWSDYVAACGGELDPRFFMSHLSEMLYGEWLGRGATAQGG